MARQADEDEIRRKYGEPLKFDPEFKGPLKRRSCTDILCLLLFLVFLIIWIIIAVYAWVYGNPTKLVVAVDSEGKKCGLDSDVLDRPYLFFFDLTKCASPVVVFEGCNTPQICVKECPQTSWASLPYRTGAVPWNERDVQGHLICRTEEIKNSVKDKDILAKKVENGDCADWYITSTPIYRRCLPTLVDLDSAKDFIKKLNIPDAVEKLENSTEVMQTFSTANEFGVHLLQDINVSWPYIVGALVVAIVVCLLIIVLLRWIAAPVVWVTLVLIVILLGVGSYFCYRRYEYLRDNPYITKDKMLKGQWDEFVHKKELWMFLMILAAAVGLIVLLLIIFLRNRISIAITLIEEGSKAVASITSTLLFPIFPWVLQVIVLLWAIAIGIYLSSMGNPIFRAYDVEDASCSCTGEYESLKNGDVCDAAKFDQLCKQNGGPCVKAGCRFFGRETTSLTIILQLVNAFGAFWGVWFVSGLSDMILAATFATWYWTFNKRKLPFFTLTESFMRTVSYHLGTVAFGSLIIAICSFIRAIIEYTERKIKKYENIFIKAIFCCCRCFFWCLEKFLRFINRNAYIMCAIHGKNFCLSASDAFSLLMRNIIRVVVVDKVTDFLFFIGKIVVTALVVTAFYFVFDRTPSIHLNYIWLPLVIIAAATYVIASIFFGVYSMAVDTLFLCFLEDCERNDGSPEKPYYMSKRLMQVLGKRNKKQR